MDSPSFEHTALETDMKTLAMEIHRTHEMKEMKNGEGVEVLKDAIRAFPTLKPHDDNGIPLPTSATQASGPLPAYAQNSSPEVRLEIEYLLDLALDKGIGEALAESQKSSDFVQDAFHDALAGRLYPEMQRRGFVK